MGPLMPGVPFSISPDAALWVVDKIRAEEARFAADGLLPGLAYTSNWTRCDAKGNMIEHVPDAHVQLGWYRADQVADDGGIWVDVFDRKFFVHHPTLDLLRGQHLTLQRIQLAATALHPNGQTRFVLRIASENEGIFRYLSE